MGPRIRYSQLFNGEEVGQSSKTVDNPWQCLRAPVVRYRVIVLQRGRCSWSTSVFFRVTLCVRHTRDSVTVGARLTGGYKPF